MMAESLIKNLIGKSRILWENPSPTSSFGSQQITFGNIDSDLIMIEFNSSTNDYRKKLAITPKNSTGGDYVLTTSTDGALLFRREWSASGNGITFYDCRTQRVNTTTVTTNNSNFIPFRIYEVMQ